MASPMRALRCPKCYADPVDDYANGFARCQACGDHFTLYDETRDLFFRVWRKAQECEGYERDVWNRLRVLARL